MVRRLPPVQDAHVLKQGRRVILAPGHRRQQGETMNWTTSKTWSLRRFAALLGLTGALLATPGGTVMAQSNASTSAAGLVGAWLGQVTLRNCSTNTPVGTFNSLVTFHRGGTLSESAGSLAFAPEQRSSGHGIWSHQGDRTYLQSMVALIRFDTEPNLPGSPGFDPSMPISPGFFAGWATVTHTVELTPAGGLVSSGTNAFYRADGTLYRSGCSTATAQRFE